MAKTHNDPNQLALFSLPEMIPQGDGSVLVRPGKPLIRLTPRQFAKAVGISRSSVYRHIEETIPSNFVECAGPRKIYIDPEAVRWFKAHWHTRKFQN